MNQEKVNEFYITTPIYYANARPHLGHAYTTILADILRNFQRQQGKQTYFSTGTDEFGDKIVKAATKVQMTPIEFTDSISAEFSKNWELLEIYPDKFIRTTQEEHKKVVQDILMQVYNSGDIYFDEYEGLYCVGCERFLGADELVEGLCKDHNSAPTLIKEKNYFFKMSKYVPQILEHIEKNPDFIIPNGFKMEVISLLRDLQQNKQDLCISRPKSRLTWGIEIPFDKNFVTYVWFDALINYVSLLGYPNGENFKKFWKSSHHLIAKDILRPHCIYWPAMLLSCNIPLPKKIAIHGYWLMDSAKMSKSLNNQVHPLEYATKYGIDTFRYFLAKNMVFGKDSPFSHEEFLLCVNADLANNFGNLYTRVSALVEKNFNGIVHPIGEEMESSLKLKEDIQFHKKECYSYIEEFNTAKYCEHIMLASNAINKYIDDNKPWVMAKKLDEENNKIKLQSVLRVSLESILECAKLLLPVMPKVSTQIISELGENLPENWELPKNRARFVRFLE